ncbi:tripartite tricarboxylate transporter TctB family protein [Alteribacillus sp. HJP-4]|uniref:tripartite tricarboxylate transporter TctB family protein n=1 Tax=Alteribacillus sp. HJP-4 TaxID=2775394 RepID=UPI0035CD0C5D
MFVIFYNYALSLLTILFSTFFLFIAYQLPEGRSYATTLGPKDWPIIVLFLMLFMGVCLLIKTILTQKKADDTKKEEEVSSNESVETELIENEAVYKNKHWWILASLVIYTYIMGFVGFTLANAFFVTIVILIFGIKRKINAAIIGVTSTVVFVAMFGTLLNIPLPRGIAFFRELSFLFY